MRAPTAAFRAVAAAALALATGTCLQLLSPASVAARAPDDFEEKWAEPTVIASPENFQVELKIGPYRPETGDAYDALFDNDPAWMLGVELDGNLVRIPYFGTLGVGAGWGWARARGNTLNVDTGQVSDERAQLTLYPLSVLGVMRIDFLVRELDIPLMFTGKIGADFIYWKSETGSTTEARGLSPGLRWAAQVALDLNFIEEAAARNLDEEWGINRTFLLFEYYGTTAEGDSLPVGDTTFSFGLGLMF